MTAILVRKTYWGFVAIKALYLTFAGAQTLELLWVRRLSMARFALLSSVPLIVAGAAAGFHHRRSTATAATRLGAGRTELP